jgi:hypothetical protein
VFLGNNFIYLIFYKSERKIHSSLFGVWVAHRLKNDKQNKCTTKNTFPCCTKCNYIKNKLNHNYFVGWVFEVCCNLKNKNVI